MTTCKLDETNSKSCSSVRSQQNILHPVFPFIIWEFVNKQKNVLAFMLNSFWQNPSGLFTIHLLVHPLCMYYVDNCLPFVFIVCTSIVIKVVLWCLSKQPKHFIN